MLERAVQLNDGPKKSTRRTDLYKRGCFVDAARPQALGYVRATDGWATTIWAG